MGSRLFLLFCPRVHFVRQFSRMNGPSTMYKLKKSFELPEKIDLPDCMYDMKKWKGAGDEILHSTDIVNGIVDKVEQFLKEPREGVGALEVRWDLVLQQLTELKTQMASIKYTMNLLSTAPKSHNSNIKDLQGSVINANPDSPPYSLLLLKHLYKDHINVSISCHIHSSITSLPQSLDSFHSYTADGSDDAVRLILVWKAGIDDSELVVNPVKQIAIRGEVNILRYIARLGLKPLGYPSDTVVGSIQIDSLLDTCHRILHARTSKEKTSLIRNFNAKLGRDQYFGGSEVNISDLATWSALKQIKVDSKQDLTLNMGKWYQRMSALLPD